MNFFYDLVTRGAQNAYRVLTGTATLDFPSTAAASTSTLTISVPGAQVNDAVILGLPAVMTSGLVYDAYVSAPGTVTVRTQNLTAGALDPAAAVFKVAVLQII
jgi:hypothetical protein